MPLLWALLPRDGDIRPSSGFRLGYYFGISFFLVLLHWIPRLPPENVTVPFLMYPALLLMVAYLSLYTAVWGMGIVALTRGRCPYLLAAVAPGLWILLEWVRNLGVIGFPWGSLGYSQWASLPLIQFASIGGFWSVSFWIVLVNVVVFHVLRLRGRGRVAAAAALVLLFGAPWLFGRSAIRAIETAPSRGQPVVLVQPNTGNDKWNPSRRGEVISHLAGMTLDAAAGAPEDALFIWPETATPTLLLLDPGNYSLVQSVCAQIRRPLLTGFPDRKLFQGVDGKDIEARYYNAAGLLLPGRGIVESYAKIKLVPFSEWMPIPGLNRVNFGQSNFTPGDSLKVFRAFQSWGGGAAGTERGLPAGAGTHREGPAFGVLVCYESIFPEMSRRLVRDGADFLVNVTNDQWFGRSAAPHQHLTMCVFRAVENRVGIARAANTGVSCIIDPTGAIRLATPLFKPAIVQGNVRLVDRPTFYTRHGDWILGLAALGVLTGAVLSEIRRRRK